MADAIVEREYMTSKNGGVQSGEERVADINSSKREPSYFPFPCFGTEEPRLFETFLYYSLMLDGRRKRRKGIHTYETSSLRTNRLLFILLYSLLFHKCTRKVFDKMLLMLCLKVSNTLCRELSNHLKIPHFTKRRYI